MFDLAPGCCVAIDTMCSWKPRAQQGVHGERSSTRPRLTAAFRSIKIILGKPLRATPPFTRRGSERRGWFCRRSVVLIFAGSRTLRFVRARCEALVEALGRTEFPRVARRAQS